MIHFSGPLGLVSIDYTLKNLIYSETDSKTSKTFRTAADLLISCEFLFFFVLNVFVALPMELQTHVSENCPEAASPVDPTAVLSVADVRSSNLQQWKTNSKTCRRALKSSRQLPAEGLCARISMYLIHNDVQ